MILIVWNGIEDGDISVITWKLYLPEITNLKNYKLTTLGVDMHPELSGFTVLSSYFISVDIALEFSKMWKS